LTWLCARAEGAKLGLWTSMDVDVDGHPAIAYDDRTHRALKLARWDGAAWHASTVEVDANADLGRQCEASGMGPCVSIACPKYQ
jgi:hypothetical protein